MSARPVLLDASGNPLKPSMSSFRHTAHDAASMTSPELARWHTQIYSPDAEYLPEREKLLGRTQDMIRNHGITSGAVQVHLDNVIGGGMLLNATPDWDYLGITDPDVQDEWEQNTEAKWRAWAEDLDCFCDAARRMSFGRMLAQAYRSYLTHFEILASAEWLPNRAPGKYSTAIQMIDPFRLSTPQGMVDGEFLRAGIEFDLMGAPVAYHIANKMQHDPYGGFKPLVWKRVPREMPWGRQNILHVYDVDRPGQSRGKNGIVSVLAKLKMLEKFEQSSLQAAILNAMYAAVIESSLDWNAVGSAMGAGGSDDPTLKYVENKSAWADESGGIRYNGVKIPHLFPGEKLNFLTPQHPHAQFSQFESAVLRYVAAGTNLTYEQLSRDYSKTNYSSARAAMLEAWKFFNGKQTFIAGWFATLVYCLWLEEAFDRGDVTLPAGAPDYYTAKTAWCRCKWIGPGRGHVDPQKEAAATETEYGMMLTTLEEEAAHRGRDWRAVLRQRAQEKRMMTKLGIEPTPAILGKRPQTPFGERDEQRQQQPTQD